MLESILNDLAQYGKTRIGQYSTTNWHCCVDMFVTGKGVAFNVKSDFDHPTPIEAARVCQERLRLTLEQIANRQQPALHG